MNNIMVETKLEFNRYLKLMYLMAYRKPATLVLTILGYIMLIGSILYFCGIKITDNSNPYIPLIFGLYTVFIFPLIVYRSSKKNYFSNARLSEKITYEFTDEKIIISGITFHTEMDWSKTYQVLELKDWILIYQSKMVANIIFKDAFGTRLKEFKELVKNKNIKAKLRK